MTQRKLRSFESADVLLGKIDIAEIWWIRWSETSDVGMLRTKVGAGNLLFLCGYDSEVISEEDEDDMPFKMTLDAAQAIFRILEKTSARYLNKRVWAEYLVTEKGRPKVANSTFSGDVGELLLDEIKALRVEMHKEKEGEK